jgi:hypothetical protein
MFYIDARWARQSLDFEADYTGINKCPKRYLNEFSENSTTWISDMDKWTMMICSVFTGLENRTKLCYYKYKSFTVSSPKERSVGYYFRFPYYARYLLRVLCNVFSIVSGSTMLWGAKEIF